MTGVQCSVYPDPWKDIGYGVPLTAVASSITGAGTYPGLGLTTGAGAVQGGTFDFDPAYWLVAGATGLKLRCIYRVATNAVLPGQALTFDLQAVTGVAGGSGANTITSLGGAITGTQKVTTPSATNDPGTSFVLPEIDAPAAGLYSVCLTVGGLFTAASRIVLFHRVEVRNVFP